MGARSNLAAGSVILALTVCSAYGQPQGNTVTVLPRQDNSATGELRFREKFSEGQHYVGFKAPAVITANKIWELPGADGTVGYCLKTNGALVLQWGSCSGGSTPDISHYDFSLAPGTFTVNTAFSTAGAKVVTIASPDACPLGVGGAHNDHWLRLTGDGGDPSTVLIEGGSCTSGGVGTLEFTTTETYTAGSVTIESASDGAQEALWVARETRSSIPMTSRIGGYNVYAPVHAPVYTGIHCTGRRSRDDYITALGAEDGCVFNIRFGAGTTTGQAFHLQSGVTFDGLSYNYPDQDNDDSPDTYPPTLRIFASAGNGVSIINSHVENAYTFIDASGPHNHLVVENITGHALHLFALIDNAFSVDTFKNIHIVSTWITDTVVTGDLINFDGMAAEYTAQNGTFLHVKRADLMSLKDVSAYGFKFGLRLEANTDGSPVGSYGTADGLLCDTCMFGIYADDWGIAKQGWQMTNSQFISWNPWSADHSGSAIYLTGPQEGPLQLVNPVLSGDSVKTGPLVYTSAALIAMVNPKVVAWSNSATDYAFTLDGTGKLIVTGGLLEGVDTATVGYPNLSPWNLLTYLATFTGEPAKFTDTIFQGVPIISSGVTPFPATRVSNVTWPGWDGATVATADEITPTGELFLLTGDTTVNTITLPFDGFQGRLCMIPDSAVLFGLDDNIAHEYKATPGRHVCFEYLTATGKWYPPGTRNFHSGLTWGAGSELLTDAGGSIKLGRTDGTTVTPYIQFHSDGSEFISTRIYSSGGDEATNFEGDLHIESNKTTNTGDLTALGVLQTWKLEIKDPLGFPWDMQALGNAGANSYLLIRDNAGANVMQFWRAASGSPVDFADVYVDLQPNADGSQALGSSARRWSTIYAEDIDFSGTITGTIPAPSNMVTTDTGPQYISGIKHMDNLIMISTTADEGGQITWHGGSTYPAWVTDVYQSTFRIFGNSASAVNATMSNIGGGAFNFDITGSIGVTNDADVDGDLTVLGVGQVWKLEVKDPLGFAWDMEALGNAASNSTMWIRDNAGNKVIQFWRAAAGSAVDFADVYVDLVPDTNDGQKIGSSAKYWSEAYVEELYTKGTLRTATDNTYDIGQASFRFKRGYFSDTVIVGNLSSGGYVSGDSGAFTNDVVIGGDLTVSGTFTISGYVPTSRNVNTSSPLTGGGSLAGDLTISCPTCAIGSGLTGTANCPTGVKTINVTNGVVTSVGC